MNVWIPFGVGVFFGIIIAILIMGLLTLRQ
jgi:hypothetical protein